MEEQIMIRCSLIWVCTVCLHLFVRKLRTITVFLTLNSLTVKKCLQKCSTKANSADPNQEVLLEVV